jgi:hypothetical protein
MGLFLVLLWCAAVARAALRHSYRIGVFNSRSGANKFPLRRQRELPSKGLVGLPILGAKTAVFLTNCENSRFYGNDRESGMSSAGETGGERSKEVNASMANVVAPMGTGSRARALEETMA